jgi:hypothetical protein
MQRLVLRESHTASVDYDVFVAICREATSHLEQCQKQITSTSAISGIKFLTNPCSSSSLAPAATPGTLGDTTSTSLTNNDKTKLKKKEVCFYCKAPGHMMKDCPRKKPMLVRG